MKKIIVLSLALLLLLPSCKKQEEVVAVFQRTEGKTGYTNTETGVQYVSLDLFFEATSRGEIVGEYTDEARGYTRSFYAIQGLDTALFLTDDTWVVWYAGNERINVADWDISAVCVCEQDVISVELFRFVKGTDDATIQELITLWREGEEAEKPMSEMTLYRSLKLMSEAYPGICYVMDLCVYESGEAVLSVPAAGRTVQVSETLRTVLLPETEDAE